MAPRAALLALAVLFSSAPAPASEWTPARTTPLAGATDIEHTSWSVAREPNGPFDRIEVHRYRTRAATVATVLYLPGTNMNGEAALETEEHNLWIFLARRGVEVFTLDYRTRFSSASSDHAALAAMKGWTTETFVGDIKAASALAKAESGRAQIYVAGFSRGVFLAYAYACAEPMAVAGLVALDGQFKSHAPKGQYDPAADLAKPILYFGNARMPGDWLLNGIYSAQKSGSSDVIIHVLEGYGHLDVLVGDHARRDVFEPTLAWIKSRASRP